jgi:phosphoribosyl 1,2-cyclic phosphodiesterase
MSLELCILGSGSTGNCSVVRTPVGILLIDAGLGPKVTAQRMAGSGVRVADVSAVCLTHLDIDHFCPAWVRPFIAAGVRVFCHRSRVGHLLKIAATQPLAPLICPFDDEPFEVFPDLAARPVALAHDEEGSHGFVIEGFGRRLGFATDLGRVPASLIEHFVDLDVLALESNYDPCMQQQSARPDYLKRRIMGGRGHLSNEQAYAAIRTILERAERQGTGLPTHIVLLHRSRQCNCPKIIRQLFCADARIASRLILSEPYQRTEWLAAGKRVPATGEQMLLSW